jgi:hypothetical protein
MNTRAIPYPHTRQLTTAGCLALLTLATAVIYACHSTPYTMVLFLGGGATLLMVAVVLFLWTIWKDMRARLDRITPQRFAPGQVIFHQGDPATHVFIITSGHIELFFTDPAKGDVALATLGPEEYFGETAILSQVPRKATARAVDAVELLTIHRDDFLHLYASLPRLRTRIEALQVRRLSLAREAELTN